MYISRVNNKNVQSIINTHRAYWMNQFFTIPWEHNVKHEITRHIVMDECLIIIWIVKEQSKTLVYFLEIFTYLDFLEYQPVMYVAR